MRNIKKLFSTSELGNIDLKIKTYYYMLFTPQQQLKTIFVHPLRWGSLVHTNYNK